MKLAAISPVYNEEKLIKGCINTWKPFVDKHIILLGTKPFYGDPEPMDNTEKIALDMGASVIKLNLKEEHKQRNAGVALLKDYDYVLVNDSDMWLTHQSVEMLINEIERTRADAYIIPQKSYWKDTDHVLVGDEFKPVIAMRPNVRFWHIGCVNVPCHIVKDAICHHLNWCAPKDILKKTQHYSHAPEYDGKSWYEKHYLGWKEGEKVILPEGGKREFNVAYDPLPEELKGWL